MITETLFEYGNLTMKRVYKAPIEQVFEAWFETSKLKQWWGCAECENVSSEVEPKVGGKYNHHMTLEGGFEVPAFATLTEYDPPNRLAYRSTDENDPMVVSVDFTEVEGGTLVRLIHANIPDIRVEGNIELCEIIKGGWTASFGKLGTLLEG